MDAGRGGNDQRCQGRCCPGIVVFIPGIIHLAYLPPYADGCMLDPMGRPDVAKHGGVGMKTILFCVLCFLTTAACTASAIATPTIEIKVITATPQGATSSILLTGSVVLEGGRCCAGGIAGQTIQVMASFEASSPFGPVIEMRAAPWGYCLPEGDMDRLAWEPIQATKSYPVQVFINWTGFYVSAQFRDTQGNVSQVYCDDISIEGMPALTTMPQ